MKRTLINKQLPVDSNQQLVKVVLRAKPTFQGRPAFDNVKIEISGRGTWKNKKVLKMLIEMSLNVTFVNRDTVSL